MKYRPKHIAEYILLRTFAGFVNLLPYKAALCVAWLNAFLGFYIIRFRVRLVKDRMRSVFGDRMTEKEISRAAWISWRNLVFNGVEMLRAPKMTAAQVQSRYDIEDCIKAIKKVTDSGRGAIVAAPHMGNWELGCLSLHLCGIPMFSIAARQKNPLTSDFLHRLRMSHGLETIERGSGSMRSVLKGLKAGHVLAITPDARMKTADLETPFLGGVANLGKGTCLFAKQANVPVIPVIATRIGWGRHQLKHYDPIEPDNSLDKQDDVRRMMNLIVEICDKTIQESPEQWFWYNKRWVLDPVDPAFAGATQTTETTRDTN
jgi:lauroyl/myristoyl acyltransferase